MGGSYGLKSFDICLLSAVGFVELVLPPRVPTCQIKRYTYTWVLDINSVSIYSRVAFDKRSRELNLKQLRRCQWPLKLEQIWAPALILAHFQLLSDVFMILNLHRISKSAAR